MTIKETSYSKFKQNGKWDKESLLRAFRFVHGNTYDYSKVIFSGVRIPVTVTCPRHGNWDITPDNHLRGKGCKQCAAENRTKMSTKEFVKKCREIHGDNYDYSLIQYKGPKEKITVICPEHGNWETLPINFYWHKKGCKECGYSNSSTKQLKSLAQAISEANRIHKNAYDYSLSEYLGCKTITKAVCKKTGKTFYFTWDHHINQRTSCPCCNIIKNNKLEKKVYKFLKRFNLKVKQNVRGLLDEPRLEIDLYLPKQKLGIELHGEYWHSTKISSKNKYKPRAKFEACQDKGIFLFQFWRHEVINRPNAVFSLLQSKLQLNVKKVGARNCEVKKVETSKAQKFLDNYHLVGRDAGTSVYYGLYYKGKLISLMSFSKRFSSEWELTRLCSRKGYSIQGGPSKLLKMFEREYTPTSIKTYADCRYTTGAVYKVLGFNEVRRSKPSYLWSKAGVVYTKYQTRHKNLPKVLGSKYDKQKSESENMKQAGYVKSYDAGHILFRRVCKND
ncbi:MAG: hypothetical protein WC967_09100 [Balneolaceae bacterium]